MDLLELFVFVEEIPIEKNEDLQKRTVKKQAFDHKQIYKNFLTEI